MSRIYHAIEFRSNASSACLQNIRVLQKRAVRIIAHANYYAHASPIANELGILLLDDFIINILNVCLCLQYSTQHFLILLM